MIKPILATLALALLAAAPASAQETPSLCHAIAEAMPRATFVSMRGPMLQAQAPGLRSMTAEEVTITYIHHASYRIESPDGVVAITDYSGFAGDRMPTIATMNKAHSTHFTDFPDPGIAHVLRGWNPEGGPAEHHLTVGDMLVRNVPTDIRSYLSGGMEPDGNSIFVFETAGLCIGHLGHLHHMLTDKHYAEIGRLDVVMVPVDGGMTMSQGGMGEIVDRLRSRVVLPMHRFRGPIERFLEKLPDFAVERPASASITMSARTLPERPTVIVLQGV